MFGLYNAVLHVALLLWLLVWPLGFVLRPGAYNGLRQRFACYPSELVAAFAGSRPIWIHAASVGEVRSAAPLVRRIRRKWPDRKLLVSTVTATGRQTACEALPEADGVTYLPLDLPWLVSRSLRRFDPELIILLETEIWPNFVRGARRRGVPTLVLSGRLSDRGANRYRYFRALFKPVLGHVSGFGMQDEENAARIRGLGVDPLKITVTGSLKHAGAASGPVPEFPRPGGRRGPVVVAGSTHRGEEEMVLDAFTELCRQFSELLMILAPRHPERFGEVERLLRRRNLPYRKQSEGSEASSGDFAILLLDTLGDLPRYYGCADVAFVGGTLVPAGGHNPIEPALWGKPVLFGPHRSNMAEDSRELLRQGGGVEVHGREELAREVAALLSDRTRAAAMGCRARTVADSGGEVMSSSMNLVCRHLRAGRSAASGV